MSLDDRKDGLTTVGSDHQGFCAFAVNTKPGTASGFVFLDSSGGELYLWFQDGKLRVGDRTAFETQTGGFPIW